MGKSFKDFVIQAVLNKVYKIYPIGLPRVYLSTLLCLMRVRSEQDNICFIVLSSSLSLSLYLSSRQPRLCCSSVRYQIVSGSLAHSGSVAGLHLEIISYYYALFMVRQ